MAKVTNIRPLGLDRAGFSPKVDKTDKKQRTSKLLGEKWKELVIGQDEAIDRMTPYVNRYVAGLSISDKTVGNFFLLGPTGVGKTKTAQALAEVLHKSPNKLIMINCAEFQGEHEIAKLIGSPPGYLGHRETTALLNDQRIKDKRSEDCTMTIIVFDEIDKASVAMFRILLGVLETATLRLGDNSIVNFENCLIICTSNVGSKEIMSLLDPAWGFNKSKVEITETKIREIEKAGGQAFKRLAQPEFMNRIDEIITFRPLTEEELHRITELELAALQKHIVSKLSKDGAFTITHTPAVVKFLTDKGGDIKFGARSVKRAITKYLYNPVTNAYLDGDIESGDEVRLHVRGDALGWKIHGRRVVEEADAATSPSV